MVDQSARDQLLPAAREQDYGASNLDLESGLALQRAQLRAQDAALESLTGGVRSVKNVAAAIHGEVNESNRMLNALSANVDDVNLSIRNAESRTDRTDKSPYSIKNFCLLLWPTVLLIILICAWVHSLLFN